ncbi:MAG: pyruvate, phosphate dikinase [Nitrospinae bacterium]|nr:pyruvate, phosphate dikinase [Nitrospinota bacterium]
MSNKHVYFFGPNCADGTGEMKDLLGGKGAGLAEMSRIGIPVPPGFTITTEVCKIFLKEKNQLPQSIEKEIDAAIKKLEEMGDARLSSETDPLFLSVRSGSKFSMPGMMDTILNLGMNDVTVVALAQKTENAVFAYDSYRRFIQMFGNVVMGIEKDEFEKLLAQKKRKMKVLLDQELGEFALEELVSDYKDVYKSHTGQDFPENPLDQLKMARDAVFKSWNNPRARTYRTLNHISEDLGTAVNVQMMVFGNMGTTSATGVGFTRNPATGRKEFFGEFLVNAQGEDVVAGIRTPRPITELEMVMPQAFKKLKEITSRLEKHYKDIQDFEFTIQEEKLYMLQTRNGKRTGMAAVKIAVDMVNEGLINRKDAIKRIEPIALDQLLHPMFSPKERGKAKAVAKGLAASPGAAAGKAVFTAECAVLWANKKEEVVLIRKETTPDDIHGMAVSMGVLTATGGMTSHAAVVSRQMGKPAVVGCGGMEVNEHGRYLNIGGKRINEGDFISFDGSTGEVFLERIPTMHSEIIQVFEGTLSPDKSEIFRDFEQLMKWAGSFKKLEVRANADTPNDAKIARSFGANGIGLCRTEHMFFAKDRIPIVQSMILHATRGQLGLDTLARLDERVKSARGLKKKELLQERKDAEKEFQKDIKIYTESLKKLLAMQKKDFIALFKEMGGAPVTIRTLDPPLHEFLPKRNELVDEINRLDAGGKKPPKLSALQAMLEDVERHHEFNPMLGHRGCRLGITFTEITKMQATAIFSAAAECVSRNIPVHPEIMIPLVGHVKELTAQKAIIKDVVKEFQKNINKKIKYHVGTMIELPRAALTADEIAAEAEFFSFGTNDLTQTTLGISRDDAGTFMPAYLNMGIYSRDPFVSIDKEGVGSLMAIAIEKARKTKPNIILGVCGEHGGEPASVEFFHQLGLKYVSCSPYRIPIAYMAAAQAALREKEEKGQEKKPVQDQEKGDEEKSKEEAE